MTARPPQRRDPRAATSRSRSQTDRRDAVLALLAPPLTEQGVVLEDVELRTVGRRLVVRVLVDAERGISLDEVAAASQTVSELLDDSDVLGDEPYTLEVSSPGVDRPLTLPRHWTRNVGRLVAVTLRDGGQVTGRLLEVGDDEVVLELSDKGRVSRRTVALAEVSRALVQVEFSRVGDVDLGPEDSDSDIEDSDTDPDDTTHETKA